MLNMELENRRKRGKPQRRFMDLGEEDIDVTEKDVGIG